MTSSFLLPCVVSGTTSRTRHRSVLPAAESDASAFSTTFDSGLLQAGPSLTAVLTDVTALFTAMLSLMMYLERKIHGPVRRDANGHFRLTRGKRLWRLPADFSSVSVSEARRCANVDVERNATGHGGTVGQI